MVLEHCHHVVSEVLISIFDLKNADRNLLVKTMQEIMDNFRYVDVRVAVVVAVVVAVAVAVVVAVVVALEHNCIDSSS